MRAGRLLASAAEGERVIFGDVTATVGRTPIVELVRLTKGLAGRVLAKLEMRNPCGSVKDRLGVALTNMPSARASCDRR
jgi:cysteine synthase A